MEETDTEVPTRLRVGPGWSSGVAETIEHPDAMQLTIGALPAGPAVAECIETALRDDVPALLGEMGYDPFGWPRLRTAIAAYLDRLGVPTHPDRSS